MRGGTAMTALAVGSTLWLAACPRQGPQLGPGEDGLYAVAVELSHPSSAELLLQESWEAREKRLDESRFDDIQTYEYEMKS